MKMTVLPPPKPPFRPVQIVLETPEELLTLWFRLNYHHDYGLTAATSCANNRARILARDEAFKSQLWSLVNSAAKELGIDPRHD